jgi:hypothetical protein
VGVVVGVHSVVVFVEIVGHAIKAILEALLLSVQLEQLALNQGDFSSNRL